LILSKDHSSPQAYDDPIIKNCLPEEKVVIQGKEIHYGEFYHVELPQQIQDWQTKNFPVKKMLKAILSTKGDLWPHQDYMAQWSLNYFTDAGGDAVETYWSQEHGSDLRPGWKPLTYWRYNQNLKEVHSEIIPMNQWVLIPVDIVHGTKNQTGDRIALAAKLTDQEAMDLVQQYGK
jgi:hypothetical protein